MNSSATNDQGRLLEERLAHLKSVRGRRVFGLAATRIFWLAIAGASALILTDACFAFSDAVRFTLDLVYAAGIFATFYVTYSLSMRSSSPERMVARLMERTNADIGNTLVNAIDFNEELKSRRNPAISENLMAAEISSAVATIDRVDHGNALKMPIMKREKLLLGASLLAVLLMVLAAPDIVQAVLPRYIDPYGDHPPFSLTRLTIDPAGVSIHYGQNLKVSVTADGKRPNGIILVLLEPDGAEIAELQMLESADRNYFQTIEHTTKDMLYFARFQGGRTKRYPLTVIKSPRIESVTATFLLPPYTHLPPQTRQLSEYVLKGYRDTVVTLEILSNRPLKGGKLTVCGADYPLLPKEKRSVTVTFPMTADGEFTASLTDIEGNESHEKLQGRIGIISDNKPYVAITAPGVDSFAIPTAKVPIVVEASDDVGIVKTVIFRNLNNSKDDKKTIYTGDGRERNINVVDILDLRDLGVKPGDVIDYYASVTDSNPDPPQSASSPSFRLKIISFDEYRDFIRTQMRAEDLSKKYNDMLEKVEKLADEQEKLERETESLKKKLTEQGKLTEQEREDLLNGVVRQGELAKKAEKLARELLEESDIPPIYDVEKDYKEALREFSRQLAEAREFMEKSAEKLSEEKGVPSLQSALKEQREALERLGRSRKEFREGIQQANKDIEKCAKLLEDIEMFKYILSLQKELVRQSRYYQEMKNPGLDDLIRLKELAKEEEHIGEELVLLKENLKKHAEEIEPEYPKVAKDARRIALEIEKRKIEELMKSADGKLGKGDGPGGYADALAAYEQLMAMVDT